MTSILILTVGIKFFHDFFPEHLSELIFPAPYFVIFSKRNSFLLLLIKSERSFIFRSDEIKF